MVEECAQRGNRALAAFLSCSLPTVSRLVKEMKELGVVFEMYHGYGKDRRMCNMWFPSEVRRYMAARQRDKKRGGMNPPLC
jgi:hypothetical protein